ncbi:HAMP domain-containing protein [Ramlibacter sp. CrO1]|uniref:HAMP domain-containing protein n=2 Tax=Ramlibacter algicola TaxID=2795217 RepID=A0A934Q153_9BURK|nr:HAMP domain-containing protein [Ramlibacter algicola]
MLMQSADKHYLDIDKQVEQLVTLQRKAAADDYESSTAAARRGVILLIATLVLATAIAFTVSLSMSRAIVRPLNVAIEAAARIADGDLGTDVEVRGTDETADLLRALATMAHNLRQLVGEVADGARVVAETSGQIAQGNLDLSQRTEEQASTLEETASSMEELTSTVSLNAQNAKQASQLAIGASDIARQGGEAVGQVVSTMSGISASSRRISDIIGVIDGIAFQTNILALNAAVEAARAGEQGRGFAVVAAEVRNLAQRSAASAKEIKALIGESVDQVDSGARLVQDAGKTMEGIVVAAKKVSDLIAEIAAACAEQDAGIQQVNTAVSQMDIVVQQNASLVEEAAAATESMKEQSGSLLQLVSRFRLGNEEALAQGASASVQEQPAPKIVPIQTRPRARAVPVLSTAAAVPPRRTANSQWQEF